LLEPRDYVVRLRGPVVVMPVLARAKRRVAYAQSSGALEADATQTSLCAYLSVIVLAGVGLNAALGWWWADPVAPELTAASVIVAAAMEECSAHERRLEHGRLLPGAFPACAATRRLRRAALLVKCLAQSSRLRSLAVPLLEHSSRAD